MVLPLSKTMVINTQTVSSQYHFASSSEQNDRLMYSIGPLYVPLTLPGLADRLQKISPENGSGTEEVQNVGSRR